VQLRQVLNPERRQQQRHNNNTLTTNARQNTTTLVFVLIIYACISRRRSDCGREKRTTDRLPDDGQVQLLKWGAAFASFMFVCVRGTFPPICNLRFANLKKGFRQTQLKHSRTQSQVTKVPSQLTTSSQCDTIDTKNRWVTIPNRSSLASRISSRKPNRKSYATFYSFSVLWETGWVASLMSCL